jgi:para-nitrobenzyl esterase
MRRLDRLGVVLCLGMIAACGASSRPPAAPPSSGQDPPATAAALRGTRWQLVRFQGSDGTVLTPDDKAKYTIDFEDGGRLAARIDCNRGSGTWQVTGQNQLSLGPMAMTRAACPPGSLHDQIVRQLGFVRSFLIKGDRLFLSLMADGGSYELEPRASNE